MIFFRFDEKRGKAKFRFPTRYAIIEEREARDIFIFMRRERGERERERGVR